MIRQAAGNDELLLNARALDAEFMKSSFRKEFNMPKDEETGQELVYVCGNSLGPQPKSFSQIVQAESEIWAKQGVAGHLHNSKGRNWVEFDSLLLEDFRRLVGAESCDEICVNSALTTNLHNLLVFFYRPTAERFKIITDGHSFPSDYLTLESQVQLNGLNPKEALVEVSCNEDFLIDEDEIIQTIKEHGNETALVMFSGVHYLSGQVFDMSRIAAAAREAGCLVGFDLAHAIGNVPLRLAEWDADFAVWCTYKYLNAGPGSTAGFFVNRKHHDAVAARKSNILAGWWGVDLQNRFLMNHEFEAYRGARAFQQSCTPVFNTCGVFASMETFKKVDMAACLARSRQLTGYFRKLLASCPEIEAKIITPPQSGAQVSLSFESREVAIEVFNHLSHLGVISDRREPSIIRFTFTGLYNSHEEVYLTTLALESYFRK